MLPTIATASSANPQISSFFSSLAPSDWIQIWGIIASTITSIVAISVAIATLRQNNKMIVQNFCTIDEIAKEAGGFDFILADLGVSSMQIDNPKRGFSFKVDGPLDLRLNQEAGISAAERLDTITREELAGMLYENSDEPYCEELAKAITDEIRKPDRHDDKIARSD